MQAKVKWVEGDTFIGTSDSGHNVVFDTGSVSHAPSPMEMVLMSAGACSSVDVVSILKKARQQVSDVQVQLSAERAPSAPKVFTKLNLHFVVSGKEVSDVIASMGITAVNEDDLVSLCKELIAANPKIVADVKGGKEQAAGGLIGQAKKKNPNVNPGKVRQTCLELIKNM